MKVRCYDIEWDTDGEDVDLPTETILEVDDDLDIDTQIANALSDKFGWCVLTVGAERANGSKKMSEGGSNAQ